MSDIPSNFGEGAGEGEGQINIPPQYEADFRAWEEELNPETLKKLATRDVERFARARTHDAMELMANIGLISLGLFAEFITTITPKNKK